MMNQLQTRSPRSRTLKTSLRLAVTGLSLAAATSTFALTPPQTFGVNLSGGEGGSMYDLSNTGRYSDGLWKRDFPRGRFGWDYNYPTQDVYNWYRTRGITLVRLPIKWERIQHSLGATLDSTEMGRIDASIACARVAGMQVILDLHNYNRYSRYVSGAWTKPGQIVNEPGSPITTAHFTNVWQQLATRYTNNTTIYGYDIMNEPAGYVTNWQPAAQAVVNTIRVLDKKHWILIEGVNWSHSHDWVSSNALYNNGSLNITDSANKLIYSAHSYWDIGFQNNVDDWKYDGQYNSYALELGHPDMGVNSLVPFVNWVKSRGYNGLIGEYGVPWAPAESSLWATVLDRSMAYLKTNGLSGTYWAGGLTMSAAAYEISCQTDALGATDLPSMTVMRKYGGIVYETEEVAQVTSSGETVNLVTDDFMSQGKAEQFMANGVGDYITYTVPNVPAGTYNVFVRVKKYSGRGIFQLAIAGANGAGGYVNQGAAQDLHQSATAYTAIPLGSKTFTAGSKDFRFTITGKNPSSAGYNLVIDYIQLQK